MGALISRQRRKKSKSNARQPPELRICGPYFVTATDSNKVHETADSDAISRTWNVSDIAGRNAAPAKQVRIPTPPQTPVPCLPNSLPVIPPVPIPRKSLAKRPKLDSSSEVAASFNASYTLKKRRPAEFARRSLVLPAVPEEDSKNSSVVIKPPVRNSSRPQSVRSNISTDLDFTIRSLGPKDQVTVYIGDKRDRKKISVSSQDTAQTVLDKVGHSSDGSLYYVLIVRQEIAKLTRSISGRRTWMRIGQSTSKIPSHIATFDTRDEWKWVKLKEVPIGNDDKIWEWMTLKKQQDTIKSTNFSLNGQLSGHRFVVRVGSANHLEDVVSKYVESKRVFQGAKLQRILTRPRKCRHIAVQVVGATENAATLSRLLILVMPSTSFKEFHFALQQRIASKFGDVDGWDLEWQSSSQEESIRRYNFDGIECTYKDDRVLDWMDKLGEGTVRPVATMRECDV